MSLVQDQPDVMSPENIEPSLVGAAERRRTNRLKQKFVTQMTPWEAGHASVPFEVVIADLSDTGCGIIHDEPLEVGLRHLLTVPRYKDKPITLEYIVMRCDRRTDGGYSIGLEKVNANHPIAVKPKRVVSERTKLLLLLFGIFGLLIAAFAPL
jgi:hypothetical protein